MIHSSALRFDSLQIQSSRISQLTCRRERAGSGCRAVQRRYVVLGIWHVVALGLHVHHWHRRIHFAQIRLGTLHILAVPPEGVGEEAVNEDTVLGRLDLKNKTTKISIHSTQS